MKYKVGDKVRVRRDLKVGKNYGRRDVVQEMTNLAGMIATIKDVGRDYYELEEDIYLFDWTDEMIEGLWEECKPSEQVKKDNEHILDAWRYAVESKSEPKYKLIDILNKIANGELKEGTKVVCNNSTFEYRKLHKDSGRNTLDLYSKNNTSLINATYLTPVLSFEVELIEPQEPTECEHEWEEYGMYNTKTKEDKHFRKCIKCDLEEEIEPTDNTTEKIKELDPDNYNLDNLSLIVTDTFKKLNEVIRKINEEG